MMEPLGVALTGALIFGYLSRMCGGAPPKLPLGLDQHLYAVPYALVTYLALNVSGASVAIMAIGTFLAYLGAFLGKRTGHGQYMDLGSWESKVDPERLDSVVRLFWGPDINTLEDTSKGNYWRDFTGLVVTGFLVSIVASLALLFTGHLLLGLGVLLGGAAKGVAYMIGWKSPIGKPTEIGEFLTGVFGGLPLVYALIILIG